jgi:hypothetical protein
MFDTAHATQTIVSECAKCMSQIGRGKGYGTHLSANGEHGEDIVPILQ